MKNIYKVVALIAIMICTINSAEAKIFSFGFTTGSYHPNYKLKGYDGEVDANTGFQLGANFSIKVPFLELSPEIRYKQSKTTMLSNSNGDLVKDMEMITRTVDVPVVVGFTLVGPLSVEAGPNFMIYDKSIGDVYNGTYAGENQDFGKIHPEVGYILGLKLTFINKITLGARFNGNFKSHESAIGGTNYKVNNYSYSFAVGYKL